MGQVTHQMSYTKIYRTWIAMLSRCRNKKEKNYINYGARGIKVCERWYKFENFYEDMGDLPFYVAQIDRIDNEKGYYKENCQWVTAKLNSRNRRTTKRIKTISGNIVQVELIELLDWTKDQYRWYLQRYGIKWILDHYKNGTLPTRKNIPINRQDIVGTKFGKWSVLEFTSYTKSEGHLYLCECVCGLKRLIPRYNLIKNKTKQCISCSGKERRLKKI